MRDLWAMAVLVPLAGCQFDCRLGNADKPVEALATEMSKKLGVGITLQCPDLPVDKTVSCTAATADGIRFPVDVTVGVKESRYSAPRWFSGAIMAREAAKMLDTVHGLPGVEVTCPSMLHLPPGTSAECKGVLEGVDIPVRISYLDDDTNHFEPTSGLVYGPAAKKAVEDELIRRGIQGAQVSCDFKSKLSKPGSRFSCAVTDSKGDTSSVNYVVTSPTGDVNWSIGSEPEGP